LRGRRVGQSAAELIEIGALHRQELASLSCWDTGDLFRSRNLNQCAGLDPVDVSVDECIGVGPQQSKQHLVQ
jgi:hypothetical protein